MENSNAATILVADDDANLRKVICRFLKMAGFQSLQASNGLECMQLLRQHQGIPLIILDVLMPDQEGLETLKIIRSEFPAIKLLMISGGGQVFQVDYLELAEKMGADASLSKPFSFEELSGAVNKLLSFDSASLEH